MFTQASRQPSKSRWLRALPMVAMLFIAACDSPEERVEKHFARGMALLEDDSASKARLEFRNALRINPDHVGSRYQLGVMAEQEGNIRVAASQYGRVAELDPANIDVRLKLALFNMGAGELDTAKTYAEEALELAPENAEALGIYGGILYRLGDFDRAVATAQQATAIDPDTVTAHVVIISDMLRNEQPDEAMAALDGLLERLPEDETLNLLKLAMLANKGDEQGLESHLVRLIELFPDQPQFRVSLAQLYVSTNRPDAAKAQMRALLADRPDDQERALALVQLIARVDGRDAARAELERLIGAASVADSGYVRTLTIALAELHVAEGRPDDALALLRSGVEVASRKADGDRLRVKLAEIELAQGNREVAKTLVDGVLEDDANNSDALAIRAILEIDDYRPEDAILTLRQALSVDPQNARLLLLEARAHERNGNPTLAMERLASAVRASNFDPAIALQYAAALQGRDQTASAETVIEEAARRHPGNRDLLTRLAGLRLAMNDPAGANAVAEQLRALDNGGDTAQRITAATLLREGRIDEGTSILEGMLNDPEGGRGVLGELVASYISRNQTDRAVALLDDLIAQNPANLQAQILRAELYLRDGDQRAAEDALRRGVAAAPQSNAGYIILARLKLQQGDMNGAMEAVQGGLEAIPDDAALRLFLAQLLEQNGEFDRAIAVYSDLYENNQDSALLANNYASLLAEFRENDPESVAKAQRIARRLRGSTVPHFQDTYGWIAFLSGNTAEAVEVLSEAATALPNNALVRYHLGRVQAAAGNPDAARTELEAALTIDPNFPKAISARETLATLQGGG